VTAPLQIRFAKTIAFAAGLASAAGFAPLVLWPVAILCVSVLIMLVAHAPDARAAFARGWVFAVGHFACGLNWIAHAFDFQNAMPHWFGYGAVVGLSLYLAVYPAAGAWLAWRIGRGAGRGRFSIGFAAAWMATEYLRATLFTGFAWNPLGVVLLDTPASAFARWIGTYGLSGLVVLAAGLIWWIEAVRTFASRAKRASTPSPWWTSMST
jgi:apolipoprotein N-acyltransferase